MAIGRIIRSTDPQQGFVNKKNYSSVLYRMDIRLYQEFGNIYICQRTPINQSQNQSSNISHLEVNN